MSCVIIDYGLGNLLSVSNALKHLGIVSHVSSNPQDLLSADRVILPGVGAFEDGMKGLREKGFIDPIHQFVKTGKPFLGICLGMQFLLTVSEEFGEHQGLDLIPGRVKSLANSVNSSSRDIKIPHIGWNHLKMFKRAWNHTILDGLEDGGDMYFVHSYHAVVEDETHILAQTFYGSVPFSSVIMKDNVMGCQFHPEKSAESGLQILKNFIHL